MKNNVVFTENFNQFSADLIYEKINSLFSNNLKKINIALSGGKTPIPIFNILKEYNIEWDRINFFIVDERCVSIKNERSNYGNLNKVFFKFIKSNCFSFYKDNMKIDEMLSKYKQELFSNINRKEDNVPIFDLILLGMGDDGHVASLFADTKALKEDIDVIAFNNVPQLKERRLTFTFPLIVKSDSILILIKGRAKINIMNKIFNNEGNYYPISNIIKKHKNIKWIVEKK